MVEYSEMGDKESQQRRRRADGAVRSVADRSAVEENRALAPKPPKQRKGGRPWIEKIPASFDVLAATARLGGAGRLVEHLANVSERVERTPAIEVELGSHPGV